ncbi:MAG: family 78 glycoside hydrolase catalytic domain, partial [Paenibacillaceae bacterium]|nr:family 78 glycoside hydrolase catalytic domain [Paenibacillaceae bacterium]
HHLRPGINAIAVSVWHFGHSNYQYVEGEAGLAALLEVTGADGASMLTLATDAGWKQKRHEAYERYVVKRNVNLGWMEWYDANRQDDRWTEADFDDSDWASSFVVADSGEGFWGTLHPRPIPHMARRTIHPVQVSAISETIPTAHIVSVNMRDNFFPGSRDANAKIFSGFLASALEAETEATGMITFAHSRWNGVQGRFRIDGTWFAAGEPIALTPGRHLFLLEIMGIHNDVLTHIELQFDRPVRFAPPLPENGAKPFSAATFVTIGPVQTIVPSADGVQPVYGGVEKRTGLDETAPLLLEVGRIDSLEELATRSGLCRNVPEEWVMHNKLLISLMHRKQVQRTFPVTAALEEMMYPHPHPTVLPMPADGGDIETIFDFGTLYIGHVEFEVEAEAGTVIDVYGFEKLKDGKPVFTFGCNNAFRYVCRQGRQRFASGTRMGLRYAMMTVRRMSAPVRVFEFRLQYAAYPTTAHAAFRCSDPLLNDIWDISRQTLQICMEDAFTDCPTFEQVFWTGDFRVSALAAYAAFGAADLARHCLELVPRSRSQSRLLLAQLPSDWQAAIPVWTFSWMMAIRDYVEHTGDFSLYASLLPEVAATLRDYDRFVDARGLLDTSSWNLLDWAPLDLPQAGVVTAQQALLAHCHRIAAEMAAATGRPEEAQRYNERYEQLREAIWRHLRDAESGEYIDGLYRSGAVSATRSVHTHMFLYLTGCLHPEDAPGVEHKLVERPAHWPDIGMPFMAVYLMACWNRMGRADLTLERIRTGWGTMVAHGSTTAWETFQTAHRSEAHGSSSAPVYALAEQLLGIRRRAPGFARIGIDPPQTPLAWVKGSLPTPHGRIDVSWTKEGDVPSMIVTVPATIETTIECPPEAGWHIRVDTIGG